MTYKKYEGTHYVLWVPSENTDLFERQLDHGTTIDSLNSRQLADVVYYKTMDTLWKCRLPLEEFIDSFLGT